MVLTASVSLVFIAAFFFAAGLVAVAPFLAGETVVLVFGVGVALLLAASFFFFGCGSNNL